MFFSLNGQLVVHFSGFVMNSEKFIEGEEWREIPNFPLGRELFHAGISMFFFWCPWHFHCSSRVLDRFLLIFVLLEQFMELYLIPFSTGIFCVTEISQIYVEMLVSLLDFDVFLAQKKNKNQRNIRLLFLNFVFPCLEWNGIADQCFA